MCGDAPRAEVVVLVECGGGFVCTLPVGLGTILVSDIRGEVSEAGFGFEMPFGHWSPVNSVSLFKRPAVPFIA